MQHTFNTLSENIRAQSVVLLNKKLATAIDLHAQVKQAHWNVRGPGFIAAHELFDQVATQVETTYDAIAERIGALGGTAQGTVAVAAKQSILVPYNLGLADTQEHIFAVAAGLAAFTSSLREGISQADNFGDPITTDLLTANCRDLEKLLWFVESHLNQQAEQQNRQPEKKRA